MVKTHYGKFGGQYIPETLMPVLHELAAAYGSAQNDPEFQRELHELLTDYVGRAISPSGRWASLPPPPWAVW